MKFLVSWWTIGRCGLVYGPLFVAQIPISDENPVIPTAAGSSCSTQTVATNLSDCSLLEVLGSTVVEALLALLKTAVCPIQLGDEN